MVRPLVEKRALLFAVGLVVSSTGCHGSDTTKSDPAHCLGSHCDNASTASVSQLYRHLDLDEDLQRTLIGDLLDPDENITVDEILEDAVFQTDGEFHRLLQGWVDEMMARYVSAHPEAAGILVPELVLLRNAFGPNAFVFSKLFCLPLAVELTNDEAQDRAIGLFPSFAGNTDTLVRLKGCSRKVPEEEFSESFATAVLEHLGSQTRGCQFSPLGEAVAVEVGPECVIDDEVPLTGADHLAVPMTADKIVVIDELVRAVDTPEEMAGILAHELAHYLLGHSHTVDSWEQSSLFFNAKTRDYSRLPTKAPALAATAEELLSFTGVSRFYDEPNAAYHGHLFHLLQNQFFQTPPNTLCGEVATCQTEYLELLQVYNAVRRSILYPNASLAPDEFEKYQAFESRFVAFLQTIPLRRSGANTGTGFGADALNFAGLPFAVDVAAAIAAGKNTHELFTDVTMRIRELDAPALARRGDIAATGFAKYTSEVAADELMAELMASVGLNPATGASTFITIAAYDEKNRPSSPLFSTAASTCEQMRDNKWQVDGKISPPLWGFPTARHPSPCWRTFNVDRLIEEQGLTPNGDAIDVSNYLAARAAFLE